MRMLTLLSRAEDPATVATDPQRASTTTLSRTNRDRPKKHHPFLLMGTQNSVRSGAHFLTQTMGKRMHRQGLKHRRTSSGGTQTISIITSWGDRRRAVE